MSHSLPDSLVQPLAGHSRRRLSAGRDCLPTVFGFCVLSSQIHCRLATDVLQNHVFSCFWKSHNPPWRARPFFHAEIVVLKRSKIPVVSGARGAFLIYGGYCIGSLVAYFNLIIQLHTIICWPKM